METSVKLGMHIRKWRTLKAVKQKDLAAALGIGESTMSNLENNLAGITLSQLEIISAYLQVSIPELFTDPTVALDNKTVSRQQTEETNLASEQELMYAVIRSLEKKDQQIQAIVQDVLELMQSLARVQTQRR